MNNLKIAKTLIVTFSAISLSAVDFYRRPLLHMQQKQILERT